MVEVGKDLKGRETRVRRWMRDRFLQNNFIFIYLSIVVILSLFYFLSVKCLLLIFFCLTCVDFFFFLLSFVFLFVFFLLYFALFFVGFGGLSLPCHLLCCLLLFVYFILFFFNLIYFYFLFLFYLHGFSGFIFRKFNCSWHFFTSSDRVPLGGGVARGPRFADWYRGVVSYTNDYLGGRVAWLTWNWWNDTEETVDDGLGRRYLGAGRCPVAPPPWLVMAGRSGRWCQLLCFFFLIFWKSIVIDGWETCFVCCRGQWKPPGWEVNSTVLSGTLFLLRHRSNCGDYWCSHVVRKGGRQVQKYSWIVG